MDRTIKLLSAVVLAGFLTALALLVAGCAERLRPAEEEIHASAPQG